MAARPAARSYAPDHRNSTGWIAPFVWIVTVNRAAAGAAARGLGAGAGDVVLDDVQLVAMSATSTTVSLGRRAMVGSSGDASTRATEWPRNRSHPPQTRPVHSRP